MIAFILACYGVLVYQLYVWQVRDAESYRAEAVTQQLKDTTLPAVRGSIYSANGKLLAKSSTVWNIVADPSSVLKSGATEDQIRTAAEHIAELLGDGTTADTVYKALTASNKDTGEPYQYRVVKKGVEKPVADAILAYADSYRLKDGAAVDTSLQTEEKEDKKDGEAKTGKATRILYLTSEQAASRTYPYGEFLASVLGFCNEDGSGAYGLEKYYDETLAGTPGRSVAETDAYGEPLASGQADVHEAIDGSNLNLTIDENVQSIVEEYLTEAMSTFTVHGRGSAIVMNVKTGAILAMASLEQFDPNDPKTITDPKMNEILAKTEIDAEDIDWLESRLGEKAVKDIIADGIISHEKTTNEKGEEVSSEATQLQGMMREAQWKNKNITELYMPGSVFKLITASAGLDSGVMSAEQTFYCGGSLTVNEGSELWEHTYRCANGEVHYEQDMAGALNHSCNLWFIQAAETLKPQIFYDYIQAFGFTQPTGIDLPNETRWTSVYNAEQMAEVDTNLYTAAFGQNESITPMQMATAVAAIANGGYLVTPYVVDSISDKDGNIISQTETNIRRQVISEEVGLELKNATIDMLGKARQVKVDKDNTIIVEGSGDAEEIKARVAAIKVQIAETTSDYDKEKLQERLAKLAGGVAVIAVGAATEIEMKEFKLRIEDALSATRAAVEEGIVPGGGVALLNVAERVKKLAENATGDYKTGVNIVLRALEEPVRQIALNAGLEGSVIIDTIKRSGKVGYGFDAYNETYVDMIQAGIVDPTKVTRSALQNAASVAAMVLTTESLVADIPAPEPAPAMPQGGMGMGY